MYNHCENNLLPIQRLVPALHKRIIVSPLTLIHAHPSCMQKRSMKLKSFANCVTDFGVIVFSVISHIHLSLQTATWSNLATKMIRRNRSQCSWRSSIESISRRWIEGDSITCESSFSNRSNRHHRFAHPPIVYLEAFACRFYRVLLEDPRPYLHSLHNCNSKEMKKIRRWEASNKWIRRRWRQMWKHCIKNSRECDIRWTPLGKTLICKEIETTSTGVQYVKRLPVRVSAAFFGITSCEAEIPLFVTDRHHECELFLASSIADDSRSHNQQWSRIQSDERCGHQSFARSSTSTIQSYPSDGEFISGSAARWWSEVNPYFLHFRRSIIVTRTSSRCEEICDCSRSDE